MKLEFKHNENFLSIKISGKLNTETYQNFIDKVNSELTLPKDIIIDMAELHFISSAGLRGLLIIAKDIDLKGRKLVLFGVSDTIKDIFKITGFSEIFPICESFQDALGYINN